MAKRKQRSIAEEQEIKEVFTRIMRGEMLEETIRKGSSGEERITTPPKISERCKAAELLGKQLGLFDRKEELQPKGDVSSQIRQALKELHDRAETGSS